MNRTTVFTARLAPIALTVGLIFSASWARAQDDDLPPEAAELDDDDDDSAPSEPDDVPDEPAGDTGDGEPTAAAGGDGETDYPPEALEFLPREVLDGLPRLVTRFLRGQDYKALREACPQESLEEVGACLDTPEVEKLFETLLTRGVVASMLEYMDVELPNRLSDDEYDVLAELCDQPGEAWGKCVLEKGLNDDDCGQKEDALAECLVGNDLVGERYLAVVKDKKAVFGKELYVEFAGLMAVLPLDAIKALREECPQADVGEAAVCFQKNEIVGEIIAVFYQAAEGIIAEARKELGEGVEFDTEGYTEKFTDLFLTLPSRTIGKLADRCEKKYPELETIKDPTDLDKALECMTRAAKTDPIANPAYISTAQLREWLDIARSKVVKVLQDKEHAAQKKSFERILVVLVIVAAVGFFAVLLMPLFLKKKFPDRMGLLWKASAIAAVTFAVTVLLLGAALLAMRTVQGAVATSSTSPKMKIAEGAFEVLRQDDYVEGFSDLSKERLDFIKGPLKAIVTEEEGAARPEDYAAFVAYVAAHWAEILQEPELKHLAKNANTLKSQTATFKSVIGFYKKVDWLMGLVPIVLAVLAVLLYLLPLRETLVDIASAPARAAQGTGSSSGMLEKATGTVTAEMKSLLPFLALILIFLPLTGIFLALAVTPLVELVLGFSFITMFYILFTEASSFALYASLGSAIVLLVTCIAIYILAMVFFIGTVRKILRSKFHYGHTFAEYKRFWIIGSLAVIGVMLFPVVYVNIVGYIAVEVWEPDLDVLSAMDMVMIPLPALVLFPILFWAVRGLKALKFIKGYPVAVTHDPEMVLAAAEAMQR